MTGPQLTGLDLGAGYDYGSLERALNTAEGQALPEQVKATMRATIARGRSAAQPDAAAVLPTGTAPVRPSTMDITKQGLTNVGELITLPVVAGVQFAHDFTAGLIPTLPMDSYSEDTKKFYDMIVKPLTGLLSIGAQVRSGIGLLSHSGKIPMLGRIVEQLPQRLRQIGVGAIVGGAVDAARPEVPKDPSKLDITAWTGTKLADATGMAPRAGMAVSGAILGGGIGEVFGAVASGIQTARVAGIAARMGPEEVASIRSALVASGVTIEDGIGRYAIAQKLVKNWRKVALTETAAGVVSERMARETYILDELFGSAKNAQVATNQTVNGIANPITEEEGRLVAGIFRSNPGGMSLVTRVTNPDIVGEAMKKLGIKLDFEIIQREAPFNPSKAAQQPAVKLPDGRVFASDNGTHSNIIQELVRRGEITPSDFRKARATELDFENGFGFVDEGGNFLTREAALTSTPIKPRALPQYALGTEDLPKVVKAQSARIRKSPEGRVVPPNVVEISPQLPRTGVYDVIISRPQYEYVAFGKTGRLAAKVTQQLKGLAAEASQSVRAPKTTEAFILADGTPVRGGFSTTELERKLHLQKPVVDGVPRPDLALKSASQHIRMDLVAERELVIDLPARMTQEQFNAVGRSLDAVKMDKVTLRAFGGKEEVLVNPLGGQVQDAITGLVKPIAIRKTITPKMVDQVERTGVFEGQAAVLPDGTAASIVSSAGKLGKVRRYKVRDSLTGQEHIVNEKQITLLPTSLSAELQPSSLFTQYLSPVEREALAKLRFGIAKGWGEEITKVRDLKDFGNSRGFVVNSLRGGKFEIAKVNDGGAEPMLMKDMKAAIEYIRNDHSAVPQLTPERVTNILGENINLGFIGGGGPPPLINETIPISWPHLEESLGQLAGDRGITIRDAAARPMKALFEEIDKRYSLQFTKVFENIQSSLVGSENFQARWFHGKGARLPDGTRPLNDIFRRAGKANWEKITDYREVPKGTPEAAEIWATMTPNEQRAATELGAWYDRAYVEFGVEAPFVENYMPHFRELAEKGNGTDIATLYKMMGGDPLRPPKGMDWVSDHVRDGLMDIYEKDARKVAVMYLRGAAHTRFMKTSLNEAREVVRMVADKNKSLAGVMGHYLQAVRGTEFPEQRAVIGETFRRVMEKLPIDGLRIKETAQAADKMVDLLTGSVYSSTMAFRPTLAARNASSAIVMVWPIYGGNGRFSEAILRAASLAGKEEAVAARAISHSQGARFSQTEVDETLRELIPQKLSDMNEMGMKLYDSADQFTRSVAYHAGRMRAEDAIAAFATKVKGGLAPKALEAAKRQLVLDSRMYLHDEQIVNEFFRRAGTNPELAAQFAGKQASDITNFLYGRGMQAQWMRSVGGRLFGQFGTWPMWYMDYLGRMVNTAAKNGFRGEGMRLLARHAVVNVAILQAGREVLDVDLSRWASYGSVFWSGGPGVTVMAGASTLMRGMGSLTSGAEDPLAQARITEGSQQIWQTLPTYVPFWYGARDAIRLTEANNPTEFLASVMGTRPLRSFSEQERLDRLLETGDPVKPFTSSSIAVEDMLNTRSAGRPTLDIRGIGTEFGPQTGSPSGTATATTKASASMEIRAKLPSASQLPGESTKPAESTPIKGY